MWDSVGSRVSLGEMVRYLVPLLALLLPLQPASASSASNLEMGVKLIKSKTKRNLERGAKLVHMAAEGGETEAEYVMGWLFMKGKGTSRSPKRAVRWFRRAAKKGHVKAQLALGRLLGRSRNAKHRKEAWRWLSAAHTKGAPSAKHLLSQLADGRIGDGMMKKTEKDVAPDDEEEEGFVINLGRGTPATDAELAALRAQEQKYAQESAARRAAWAKQAQEQQAEYAKTQAAQQKSAEEEAEARRVEARDRAMRRAAGLPELPRGQLSPHLRKKKE